MIEKDRRQRETERNEGDKILLLLISLTGNRKKRKKKEAKNAKQVERTMAREGGFISEGSSAQESHLAVENT